MDISDLLAPNTEAEKSHPNGTARPKTSGRTRFVHQYRRVQESLMTTIKTHNRRTLAPPRTEPVQDQGVDPGNDDPLSDLSGMYKPEYFD